MVLHSNLLRTKVFLSCNWEPRARLHGGVVRDNETKLFRHISHNYNYSTCWTAAVFFVHAVACESPDFNALGVII